MRAYFSQFGDITKLRLSRNRHTGKSKHYAFIEFASESVAKIVAATMDNYLMYGHILKCKYVPSEQLHPELWKGANRRFKATPWNRIEQKRLNKGRTRENWTKNIEKEQKRRLAKAEKLKELGYEIELPELKSVDEVPVQKPDEEVKAIEGEQEAKAIEAPVEPQAELEKSDDTPKKSKKDKKEKKTAVAEAPVESPKPKEAAAASPATKSKKKTKAKTKA
jgi:nucleolar protein 15